jgi:hypothetical protein
LAGGEFAMRQACNDAKGLGQPERRNVSPVQFRQTEFVGTIGKILKEAQLDPSVAARTRTD